MHDAPAVTAVLFGLRGCLLQADAGTALPAPGALDALAGLHQRQVPCIWLDDINAELGKRLSAVLPEWLLGQPIDGCNWPAPDPCWHALMALQSPRIEGCVLVSDQPLLLQSARNAGLWTVGLAACSPSCALEASQWQALSADEQDLARGKATLALFELGAHSVIGHLEALDGCLADIALRRQKGEKP